MYYAHRFERLNIVKSTLLPRQYTESVQILSKYQWQFCRTRTNKKHKRPQIAKTILKKKNKARGIMFIDFKLYCKTLVTKTIWYWHRNRHKGQWNKIENPKINSHI